MKCRVWSVKRKVEKCGVSSKKSVKSRVWSVKCKFWSVKCGE